MLRSGSLSCGLLEPVDPRYWGKIKDFLENCVTSVNNEEKIGQIRRSVDLNVLGDNILDIADFTVEKYEFRTDSTLSPEMRAEAVEKIKDALWNRVEEMRLRRKQILETMFNLAEVTLNEVVNKK